MPGRLFTLSAPSGTGKTTVSRRIQAEGLARVSVSHTTRLPRPGEQNGREYFFVNRDEFARMHNNGLFLETAEVYGNLYGTSAEWVRQQLQHDQNILLEIDAQGARQIKKVAPGAVSIFLRPPSIEALKQRLNARAQDSPEVVQQRLAAAKDEMARENEFDCVIINDNLEKAIEQTRQIFIHPPTPTHTQPNPGNNPVSHPSHSSQPKK